MKVLAVIPARGGSKGVPDKNIKLLGGIPLIAHAIECAKQSDKVTKVVVSTDSDKIADIAVSFGSEVILRPLELANDTANVVLAVEHVLSQLKEKFDIIILLQPTSPLRSSKDIDNIITDFEKNHEIENIISVIAFDDYHPARMYNLNSDNSLSPFTDKGETTRRQDLEPVYYRNGC